MMATYRIFILLLLIPTQSAPMLFRKCTLSTAQIIQMAQETNRQLELGEQLNELCWPDVPTDLQAVEQLLRTGANPNIDVDDTLQECLLHKLARSDTHSPLIALLLKYQAYARKDNIYGQTPLHLAAANGAPQNTALFLREISVNATPYKIGDEDTPLLSLAKHIINTKPENPGPYLEVAKILINTGANLKYLNRSNNTPTDMFSSTFLGSYPHTDKFEYLLRKEIAEDSIAKLKSMQQLRRNYWSLLPLEIIELIAIYDTHEEYQSRPSRYTGFSWDV